jgi:glutamate-1-semialdehyde 2,1-aminomutase
MSLQGPRTAEWFQRSKRVLVNGVSSQFRYWGDDDTLVVDHGAGGHVFDMDGKEYIDFQLGFGPVILGHGDRHVSEAVSRAAAAGTVFAMTQRTEIEAAEKMIDAIGWATAMRFTNTGTEATMHAIRLARGWSARDLVLKFEGAYHGAHDYVLFTTASAPAAHLGSRLRPLPIQASSGIPDALRGFVRTLPYNDVELLGEFFEDHGHDLAAVIVEPMAGNFLGIPPEPGFLEEIRRLCDENEVVLIFDEVKTGFRLGLQGAVGAYGVVPDVGTYAKAMGNGFPVAGIALSEKMVEAWAMGGIAQAGTYSGNAIGTAAVTATLERLEDGAAYGQIEKVGRSIMDGIQSILDSRGVEGLVVGHPAMFSIFLGEGTPIEFRDLTRHDARVYNNTIMAMIERGVAPCPDAREPWFTCAAHTMDDADRTLDVFEEALVQTLARAGSLPNVEDD